MKTIALLAGLALAFDVTAGHAQGTVWTVSSIPLPGAQFSKISDAIAAAADGDVILVQPSAGASDYYVENLVVEAKSLTIQARVPGDVVIYGSLRVSGLGAAQSVLVRGLRLWASGVAGPQAPCIHLRDNYGGVWFEGAASGGLSQSATQPGPPGLLVENCAAVVLIGGEFRGGWGYPYYAVEYFGPRTDGGVGLHIVQSSVFVYDALVRGGTSGTAEWKSLFGGFVTVYDGAGTGVWMEGGTLHLDGCEVKPGLGTDECSQATAPGCDIGLYLGAGSPQVTAFDSIGLGDPPTYVQSGALQKILGVSRSISATSPVREGEVSKLKVSGVPRDWAVVGVAAQPGQLALPAWSGTMLLGGPTALLVLGELAPSGELSHDTPIPELGPAIQFQRWLLQAGLIDPDGVVTLTEPTSVLLLDAAY
ncbi:MAG: hypothetical protein EPO68_11345 [Planctomycetota bacterium]|nr:MAG: hypothetical protein EPO68_11345 [Planctomycetota bacterium]